jgi:uncharacterized OB-fold protein
MRTRFVSTPTPPATTDRTGGHTQSVQQIQVACDTCGAELVPNAAYCERCGARTRRARRLVRVAIRVELLIFLLIVGLVIAFTWIYAIQK